MVMLRFLFYLFCDRVSVYVFISLSLHWTATNPFGAPSSTAELDMCYSI